MTLTQKKLKKKIPEGIKGNLDKSHEKGRPGMGGAGRKSTSKYARNSITSRRISGRTTSQLMSDALVPPLHPVQGHLWLYIYILCTGLTPKAQTPAPPSPPGAGGRRRAAEPAGSSGRGQPLAWRRLAEKGRGIPPARPTSPLGRPRPGRAAAKAEVASSNRAPGWLGRTRPVPRVVAGEAGGGVRPLTWICRRRFRQWWGSSG